MKNNWIIVFLGVFLFSLLVGCSKEYCPEDAYQNARGNLEEWEEEVFVIVASSNQLNPTQLEPVVEEVEVYVGYIKNLDAPPCLEEAKSLLLKMTNHGLKFVRERLETGISSDDSENWVQFYSDYLDELERLERCMPNCEP